MTTLALPNLNHTFFNIESHGLPPLPDQLNLPPIISEYDALVTDINRYNNNNRPLPPRNDTNPDAITSLPGPNNNTNPGSAAAALKRANKRKIKAQRVATFKTNNPMTN